MWCSVIVERSRIGVPFAGQDQRDVVAEKVARNHLGIYLLFKKIFKKASIAKVVRNCHHISCKKSMNNQVPIDNRKNPWCPLNFARKNSSEMIIIPFISFLNAQIHRICGNNMIIFEI